MKNIPEHAIPIMINSISENTLAQYSSTFKLWWQFCLENKISIFTAGVTEVISFLQFIFDTKPHKYGTFNNHRSALSLILYDNISEDARLKRFLKGINNLRPARPRYNVTWDTKPVLDYLEKMYPLDGLSLKDLSLKLATLLILITGQRVQTIFSINIDNIVENPNGFQVLITDKIKSSGLNKVQPCLDVPFCKDNPALCPGSTLKFYIEKTKDLRSQDEKYLFLSSKVPHLRASKDTISRWIKEVLGTAGIDPQFSTHSTRHASTSKAFRNGISLEVIRKTAGWSETSSVFQNFYNRPVIGVSGQFANQILNK